MKKQYDRLVTGIRGYFKKAGLKKAVLGLSGGIDSALALRLTSDALGNRNITALIMPEKGLTKRINVQDAVRLCRLLDVGYHIIPINPFLKQFRKIMPWRQNKSALINTKARIRAVILYNYANTHSALVIGTSNKTELALGYFTKYGDGACDLEVIGSLYKTDVWEMSGYLNLPKSIIHKIPSAELFHGHTDEKEIGETYKNIDLMLKGNKPKSRKIRAMIEKNRHKAGKVDIVR
ncbi:NAD+ synthase [Candidatus Woesearchaeota archaeon]|nr:NAD+ synthase [Candidatus Woesearchaeota archaeon]